RTENKLVVPCSLIVAALAVAGLGVVTGADWGIGCLLGFFAII
ncbi:MAG: hypothetical protein JWQ38_1476, partial [Flavipsychrobacter sp.]|nr:hypothetical protein [Flavipsychrobacter sp.]